MVFGQPMGLAPPSYFGEEEMFGGLLAPVPAAPPLAAAVKRQRGGFGTRDIIGILADAVLAGTGRPAVYGPQMAHRRSLLEQAQQEEQQYTRHRADANADWMARQEYERTHPAPAQPTSLQRDADYYRSIGRPDLAEALLTSHASPLVGVDRVNERGETVREYIRPGITGQPAAPPPPRLNALPPGSRPLPAQGGPTRQGSGTFR